MPAELLNPDSWWVLVTPIGIILVLSWFLKREITRNELLESRNTALTDKLLNKSEAHIHQLHEQLGILDQAIKVINK